MNEIEIIIANLKAEVIKLKVEKAIYSDYDKNQPILEKRIAGLEKEIHNLEPIKVS